jgi:hypothetical protein
MIDQVFDFLRRELNLYAQLNIPDMQEALFCEIGTPSAEGTQDSPVLLSLLNLEEDRVAKGHEPYFKHQDKILRGNPKVPLNIYCMFSSKVGDDNNDKSLINISHVIRFFQSNNVFTSAKYSNLNSGIERLVADIYNVTIDQQNQIWAINGGKYRPCILYKVRMIEIYAEPLDEVGVVTNINLIEKE